MTTNTVWLAALAPTGLVAAAVLSRLLHLSPRATNRIAQAAALLALATALGATGAVALLGTLRTATLGAAGIGASLYLDRLSIVIFCLVSFVGVIVLRYSVPYLAGDPRQARFSRMLCRTVAAVLTLAISGNLLLFLLGWIATSLSLHQLLVFYPERPAAILAARKKYLTNRVGDLCLGGAAILLYRAFGTLDYAQLFAAARADHGLSLPGVPAAACLIVIAGLLKSAQFPLHGWLLEVMETPTPVSALLHAGIINAGGFLVLRFTGIVTYSVPSLDLLAVIGGFTALFGSVVMLTQTSIKTSLACSTVAQMGFMMLECGLGAFSAALLHIVAHSLYKAHAFLSSGSVIDIARATWTPSPGGKLHPRRNIIAIAAVLLVTFAFSSLTGATLTRQPGVFALGAVLLLSLTHLLANSIDERPTAFVVLRVLGLAVLVSATYFALQLGTETLMARALPKVETLRGPFGVVLVSLVVVSFAAVTFLQGQVPGRAQRPRWQALYAHVANGFYVNTLANRLILLFWPGKVPTKAPYNLPLALKTPA